MGLKLFGDQLHKMPNVTGVVIPPGVDGDAVRSSLLNDFGIEIGTSFGPLHGRIWRIGTMDTSAARRTCCIALPPSTRHCDGRLQGPCGRRASTPRLRSITRQRKSPGEVHRGFDRCSVSMQVFR